MIIFHSIVHKILRIPLTDSEMDKDNKNIAIKVVIIRNDYKK